MTGKHYFLFILISMTVMFSTGCSTDYDYSTDHVQIGCRVKHRRNGGVSPEVSCFRFGFPWWYDENGNNVIYGIDLTPFTVCGGELNGLGISLASLRGTVNGVIVAPLCSLQDKTNGLSFSLFNRSFRYSPGMQVGLANFNTAGFSGRIACLSTKAWTPQGGTSVQLALLNLAGKAEAQLGVINTCSESMFQIGLLNFSPKSTFQFGLLNCNRESCFCEWFPVFNFKKNTFD